MDQHESRCSVRDGMQVHRVPRALTHGPRNHESPHERPHLRRATNPFPLARQDPLQNLGGICLVLELNLEHVVRRRETCSNACTLSLTLTTATLASMKKLKQKK